MSTIRRNRNPSSINRVVSFHLFRHLVQFPYGGRLCGTHLRAIYMMRKDQQVAADELDAFTELHSYEMQIDQSRNLDNTNALLIALKQSPLRSQTTIPLEHQAPGAIRRLTNKLRQAVSIAGHSCINQIVIVFMEFPYLYSFKCCRKYCAGPKRHVASVSSTGWYQGKTFVECFSFKPIISRQRASRVSSENVSSIRREELTIQ